MKIAMAVHGRFHAFDLARSLIRAGHDVHLFTNYPAWAVRRFKLTPGSLASNWLNAAGMRAASALGIADSPHIEPQIHEGFGKWAAAEIRKHKPWDFVHIFSGIALETLQSKYCAKHGVVLVRGSAHIEVQDQILADEEQRVGLKLKRPSPWMIRRELQEYSKADRIIVLSTFARESFVAQGVEKDKLLQVPLGVETTRFRASPSTVAERSRRIRSGQPLRILMSGTLSFRKGLVDLISIIRKCPGAVFRFVGTVPPQERRFIADCHLPLTLIPKVPQFELPALYADADMFVFPTLEDGFAVVLAQAAANRLPVLTTTNSSGPDIVTNGRNGWVFPIRQPEMFVDRINWCHDNRERFATMIEQSETYLPRDWDDVASDLVAQMTRAPVGGELVEN
ncbi:MAG: glycosyltransferase family 4 protein [Bryobacteraceae bacterium]